MMRIETEDWPENLRTICSERCAERGEPACHEVDLWINPLDPDRGKVCAECAALTREPSNAE